MEISRSQYQAFHDNVLELPCFRFRGPRAIRGEHGQEIAIDSDAAKRLLAIPAKTFANAIVGLASSRSFEPVKREVFEVPETIFDLNLKPEVFSVPAMGKVVINLGMYLTLRSIPRTLSWLYGIYGARS